MAIGQAALQALQNASTATAWIGDSIGVVAALITRFTANFHAMWAFIGILLLAIAMMNVWLLSRVGLSPSTTPPALVGSVVLGSIGSRLVGNWLTLKAK
ncbi:conserved membrane hypothetical protein [Paraburkholderia piptadeniae]|uniref:Uncharacterized protein n=2 Tax=Paraburkholderia TaxID=1822464 RepID=A0A7X1NL22_9BURK|nr:MULTISPECIES: hypothetical protein [Paraburkholderia]MPW23900.1 hypothetical protein [Paraburkholderia franconis]SIT52133.1 conserved membrane hypothetical protein [Paraburkholderia piptadeniae]